MKSIFALALGLTLMAGTSFAQRIGTVNDLSSATSAAAEAFILDGSVSKGGDSASRDVRGSDDVKEAPLSQGSLAALLIMGAMAGLLVVQRQRS